MPAPRALLLGRLERHYLIPAQGQPLIDEPGGNLLYAAAGLSLWQPESTSPGLLARVGRDFPSEWLHRFEELGFDITGIRILDEDHDLRSFIAYTDVNTAAYDQPIPHFARLGLPLPKSLLGYERPPYALDSLKQRGPLSLREGDLPSAYAGARHAHLCPLDYFSHILMPPILRTAGVEVMTLETSSAYMHPSFWNEISKLVSGLHTLHTTEKRLRTLFSGRSEDLWEMAERLTTMNCGAVLIRRDARGQFLYDARTGTRYHIPPYPSQPRDRTHEGSAFCGGYLASLLRADDPLRAALHGSVTASLAAEGSGAFYVMDSYVGLAASRLEALSRAVQVL